MYSNPVMPRNSASNESDERHFDETVRAPSARRSAVRIMAGAAQGGCVGAERQPAGGQQPVGGGLRADVACGTYSCAVHGSHEFGCERMLQTLAVMVAFARAARDG